MALAVHKYRCVSDCNVGQGQPSVIHKSQHIKAVRNSEFLKHNQNVLKKWLKVKPYTIQVLQALSEGDEQRRYDFCKEMLNHMDENENFLGKLSLEMKQLFT